MADLELRLTDVVGTEALVDARTTVQKAVDAGVVTDRFLRMFGRQAAHMAKELVRYGKPPFALMFEAEKKAVHASLCAHMHSEVDEIVRCSDWKMHSRTEPSDVRQVAEEVVDLWKFSLNLLMLHGITPDQFVEAFDRKSFVVERRVGLERMKEMAARKALGPILVCDLDGVVCARDTALLGWANAEYPVGGRSPDKWTSTWEFKKVRGQKAYEELKRRFYERGGFLDCCQVVVAAVECLRKAREARIPILVCTSRDVKRYSHLEWETHEWLRRHSVPYDAIVFAAEKERALTWVDPWSIAVDDEQSHVDALNNVCEARLFTTTVPLADAVAVLNGLRHSAARVGGLLGAARAGDGAGIIEPWMPEVEA